SDRTVGTAHHQSSGTRIEVVAVRTVHPNRKYSFSTKSSITQRAAPTVYTRPDKFQLLSRKAADDTHYFSYPASCSFRIQRHWRRKETAAEGRAASADAAGALALAGRGTQEDSTA